ncbi:MAG: lytic transglycosylase domain-containing protein, partial [Dehalococcoidia bacterium]|nr:lytic transglycosylase domain-containing protein [Dehalococcoidia bacterium]
LAAADDHDAARSVWDALRQQAPDGYYGLRAAVLLDEASGDGVRSVELGVGEEPGWDGIESWLEGAGLGDSLPAGDTLTTDGHWVAARDLRELGMSSRADAELRVLLEERSGDPVALYQVARAFHEEGLDHFASQAATRLLEELPQEAGDAPADLWRLAYPAPLTEVVREVTDEIGVPNLLLLALVRQESFFDPFATSPAGARGLTQVVPKTAQAIAADLGVADFEVADLHRPAVSLRFGASYLDEQLAAFDGSIYHGLAAYSAGPDNARRWADAAGGDVDRFVAEIDFSETEAYVQIVVESLTRYRQLYEGLEEPALQPRDQLDRHPAPPHVDVLDHGIDGGDEQLALVVAHDEDVVRARVDDLLDATERP